MNKEFRILRRNGGKVEYLRHEGHSHFWSRDINDAMIYTKLDLASELCRKVQGTEVVTTIGDTAYIRPL